MLLTKDTTIYALTSKYPFLVDALAARNKDFEKLKNPLLRQSVGSPLWRKPQPWVVKTFLRSCFSLPVRS